MAGGGVLPRHEFPELTLAIDPLRPVDMPLPDGPAGGGRPARGTIGGSWGAYWWNGNINSSELDRGFDIFELLPSDHVRAQERSILMR